MSFSPFDHQCMGRALQLARKGWYTADPNPRVGCVIARGGEIVGEGYHRRAGEGHAEVNALADAGADVAGATAYVTLEPCNHWGKTGPCAGALVDAGVAEVVYAMADPNGEAAGGIQALLAAGVAVRGPLMEAQARGLNPGFIKRCETGLPRVTVKLAMSLDGRTAMASGESQWITGPDARRDVQLLRAGSSAIVTGIGTVLDDDPAMNVRAAHLPLAPAEADEVAGRQPLRVVVDSRLRTPPAAKIIAGAGGVLIVAARAGQVPGAEVVALPGEAGAVDLAALLAHLGQRGCNEVLVEAGPRLCGAIVGAGLADRLVVYMAGKLLGSDARPLMHLPLATMAEAVALNIEEIRRVGDDWRITAIPEKN